MVRIPSVDQSRQYKLLSLNLSSEILSSSQSNPNTIYAVFGSGYINEYGFNYSYGNHIIKSTNNGTDWFSTNIPENYIF